MIILGITTAIFLIFFPSLFVFCTRRKCAPSVPHIENSENKGNSPPMPSPNTQSPSTKTKSIDLLASPRGSAENENEKKPEKKSRKNLNLRKKVDEQEEPSKIQPDEAEEILDGKTCLVDVLPSSHLEFPHNRTSHRKFLVKNVTKRTVIFKIRISCTEYYRVNPVFGILPPEGTEKVYLTHTKSPIREDKMYVVNTLAPKGIDEKNLASVFKTLEPVGFNKYVKISAV